MTLVSPLITISYLTITSNKNKSKWLNVSNGVKQWSLNKSLSIIILPPKFPILSNFNSAY